MSKPFSREEFEAIYSRVPRLCVDLVIQTQSGTLLTKRGIPPHKGSWHLPGGTVYFKERLEDTARRVAAEELRVDIEVEECLGYMEFLHLDRFGGIDHPVSLVFRCLLKSSDFMPDEDTEEINFFNALPEPMFPEHRAFLEKLRQ